MEMKFLHPDPRKRNFGFGRKLNYAIRTAIDEFYGDSNHFSTRRTHKRRIKAFTDFCYQYQVTDARDIDHEIMGLFGDYIRHRISNEHEWTDGSIDKIISVSYAQNLISTANTAMRIIRGDYGLRISPSQSVCEQRSFNRQMPIEVQLSDVLAASNEMLKLGMSRGAAVTLMAYAWGMRVTEALLQNQKRMQNEIALTGSAAILEGCKGGRVSLDRTIVAGSIQHHALKVAICVSPTGSRNLLSETDTVHSLFTHELKSGREILKKHSIISYRELRAAFALEQYKNLTGGHNPMHGRLSDRELDRMARAEVSRMLGHNRPQPSNSYIGGY